MKLFHVSSFVGNLGDIVSNFALHQKIARYDITPIEVRRFYRNYNGKDKLEFDQFLDDLQGTNSKVLVGGGGFLDYWVPNSRTGTTFDVDLKVLENSSIPIQFASIGSFPHNEVPDENFSKFRRFLEVIGEKQDCSIMFRNDGSFEHLVSTFGDAVIEPFERGYDNAYMYPFEEIQNHHSHYLDSPYILVNLAPDQLEMRSENRRKPINIENFFRRLAIRLEELSEMLGAKIVFVPHILKDLTAIYSVCEKMPDLYVREKVVVAPLRGQAMGLEEVLSLYKYSALNICTRLHANIISYSLGSPTVTLGALDRVVNIARSHKKDCIIDLESLKIDDFMSALDVSRSDGEVQAAKTYLEDFWGRF